MKLSYLLITSFAYLAIGSVHNLPREEGDHCESSEGVTGTCLQTRDCEGVSYASGHCPQDAVDIQCCAKPVALEKRVSCHHPAENTCSFYSSCLEKKSKCGSKGYPLGYGLKYCKKFTAARPKLSAKGKAWVTKTMTCLQKKLVPYGTGDKHGTCKAIKSFAFATHPGCYVSSGVCALPPSDWEVIIKTVSLKELFGSTDALKATLKTSGGCVKFYEHLIKKGVIKILHKIKDKAKDIWHKATGWL